MSLEILDINVIYNKDTSLEKIVLKSASLNVKTGEFVAIIGNNGAGKSTLAKVIAGEIIANSGIIKIDGLDVSKLLDFQRSEFIGRVFQDPSKGTASTLTALENLAFAYGRGKLRSLSCSIKKSFRSYIINILQEMNIGLEDKLDQPVFMLSGGQRQVLSLLMAVLRPAKILLLDEHTAALDPDSAALVMKMTHKLLRDRNMSTIMITHDMSELDYCDNVYAVSENMIKKVDINS